jgi:hypothetical protein
LEEAFLANSAKVAEIEKLRLAMMIERDPYMKVMVAIDTEGRVLPNEERKKYRIVAR